MNKLPKIKFTKLSFLRLSTQDQIHFTKRLAILLKAGVPILESLRMLKNQTRSKTTQKVMASLAHDVEGGLSLAKGLHKFKNLFGDLAINIIQVGEISGMLTENLNHVAEELKKKQILRRKVVSSLIYPFIIVLGTIGITIFLTVFLFPKILPIFKSFKFELPWTTKLLIAVSDLFSHHGLLIALGLVVLIIAWHLLLKLPAVRFRVHQLIIKLPIAGKISQSYHLANFCRTLGTLLKSNVMIVEALTVTADATTNLVYRREFHKMATAIAKGKKVSVCLAQRPDLFPQMTTELLTVGETAGNLTDVLIYLGELHETEVEDLTKNLSTLIEPVLMIFMGLLVGFVALSIITPIYGITQNLHP